MRVVQPDTWRTTLVWTDRTGYWVENRIGQLLVLEVLARTTADQGTQVTNQPSQLLIEPLNTTMVPTRYVYPFAYAYYVEIRQQIFV